MPPELLVATNREALTEKIGVDYTEAILGNLKERGLTVLDDLPRIFDQAALRERMVPQLKNTIHRGVLILGGLDVVPAARLDCLTAELRRRIDPTDDPDQFFVWSDGPYGDIEGDGVEELPVSRLPDLADGEFLANALSRPPGIPAAAVNGVRNIRRPFADKTVQTEAPLLRSEPTTADTLSPGDYTAPNLYFMLHGDDSDGTIFWGEGDDSFPEAVRADDLPATIDGVVFAGCCWGALIVRESARRLPNNEQPTPRTAESSLALSCLARGARAFIGCTGAHYSPPKPPYNYLAGPLHRSFWEGLRSGKSPARALFDARIEFLRGIPHPAPDGKKDNLLIALELKLFQEFTCLGRGF